MAVVRNKTTSNTQLGSLGLEAARATVTRSGLADAPVNIWALAEYLGLEVQKEAMDDEMSGYLEFRGGRWVAGVNSLHHQNRQRFTLAHEIAHFLLHRQEQEKFVDELFTRRVGSRDAKELQADAFAAELLVPEKSIRSKISSGITSISDLASFFGVSNQALRYRAEKLGYKST